MRRVPALLLALVLVAAGCGLSENDSPRIIASGDLPEELVDPGASTTTTIGQPSPTSTPVAIYYVTQQEGATHLVPVVRDVKDAARPADRLGALLLPPSADEQSSGIQTSIPSDTVLIDTELVGDELVLDLSGSLFDVQGEELRNAFAQLVWTATEMDGVRFVRFLVDGQEVNAPDANGIEQSRPVQRSDYVVLAPS